MAHNNDMVSEEGHSIIKWDGLKYREVFEIVVHDFPIYKSSKLYITVTI